MSRALPWILVAALSISLALLLKGERDVIAEVTRSVRNGAGYQ